MSNDTLYEVLDVRSDASLEDIRAAFRRLSKRVHPDQGGSDALFRRVQDAYDTLSDPKRRAEYDRSLHEPNPPPHAAQEEDASGWVRVDETPGAGRGGAPRRGGPGPPPPPPPPPGTNGPQRATKTAGPAETAASASARGSSTSHFFAQHPAGTVAGAGGVLMFLGGALARVGGGGLAAVGFLVLAAGLVAMAGSRRAAMRYGAIRSGFDSVDQMSGTQFEILLESLFAEMGYRVSRVGGRGDFGADLILDASGSRTVVQAKRWVGTVRHDAVQQAVAAMAHYRATHSMVVTTSTFSGHARALAQSNGVILWDRAVLARELARTRGLPVPAPTARFFYALTAGVAVCFSFLWHFSLAMASTPRRAPARRRRSTRRRR